jgi:hypothetical protein
LSSQSVVFSSLLILFSSRVVPIAKRSEKSCGDGRRRGSSVSDGRREESRRGDGLLAVQQERSPVGRRQRGQERGLPHPRHRYQASQLRPGQPDHALGILRLSSLPLPYSISLQFTHTHTTHPLLLLDFLYASAKITTNTVFA